MRYLEGLLKIISQNPLIFYLGFVYWVGVDEMTPGGPMQEA